MVVFDMQELLTNIPLWLWIQVSFWKKLLLSAVLIIVLLKRNLGKHFLKFSVCTGKKCSFSKNDLTDRMYVVTDDTSLQLIKFLFIILCIVQQEQLELYFPHLGTHILNVYFPCLHGLDRFFNGLIAFLHSFDFMPDHDQSSEILNYYPQLGTKCFEVYPFFITPQQLYLCISSTHYHQCVSLHG